MSDNAFPSYPIVAVYAADWALVLDQVDIAQPWSVIHGWLVGWCIEDTETHVVLAPQYFPVEDHVRNTVVVPRACIVREYTITQAPPTEEQP